MMARFSFCMALAGLIGAVVGSNRSHANAVNAPWATYLGAGLASSVLFVIIALSSNYVMFVLLNKPLPAAMQNMNPLDPLRSVPWSALPFVLTFGICILARQPRWPFLAQSSGNQVADRILERILDGVAVSILLLVGWYLAVALLQLLNYELPPLLQEKIANTPRRWIPIPILWPLQAVGFIIGFFFVRDVRRAAHATIIDPAAQSMELTTDIFEPRSSSVVRFDDGARKAAG